MITLELNDTANVAIQIIWGCLQCTVITPLIWIADLGAELAKFFKGLDLGLRTHPIQPVDALAMAREHLLDAVQQAELVEREERGGAAGRCDRRLRAAPLRRLRSCFRRSDARGRCRLLSLGDGGSALSRGRPLGVGCCPPDFGGARSHAAVGVGLRRRAFSCFARRFKACPGRRHRSLRGERERGARARRREDEAVLRLRELDPLPDVDREAAVGLRPHEIGAAAPRNPSTAR